MRGDFTRDSFEPANHGRRVLYQQGRVQIDADFNEQSSILLRYLQTLTTDLIGRFGGPSAVIDQDGRLIDNDAFKIDGPSPDFTIGGPGHYYVDGLPAEIEAGSLTYATQPDLKTDGAPEGSFLVYLEVFERTLAAAQSAAIAEPALEGLDTAARSRVVWQVKVTTQTPDGQDLPLVPIDDTAWNDWLEILDPPGRGLLKAMAKGTEAKDTGPCIVAPASAFRGQDNQLYRVEIHDGSGAGPEGKAATFKWSRENGSVIFPIEELGESSDTLTVTVNALGRDRRYGLQPGDWVEITDDDLELNGGEVLPLFRVQSIKVDARQVILKKPVGFAQAVPHPDASSTNHPLLRRWDGEGTRGIVESSPAAARSFQLEDGVQVEFQQQAAAAYRRGDYWLIPARVILGDVIWPIENGAPKAMAPSGISRHFAPLASFNGTFHDLRRRFAHLAPAAALAPVRNVRKPK